jgi:integrase
LVLQLLLGVTGHVPTQRDPSLVHALAELSVRHHLASLRVFFEYAVEAEAAYGNPVTKVPVPTTRKKKMAFLEPAAAIKVLDAATTIVVPEGERGHGWFSEFVATLLFTGGRMMEVLGLRVEDIDLIGNTVRFVETEDRQIKTDEKGERIVPLWPKLRTTLEPYIQQLGRSQGLLFPSPNGQLLDDAPRTAWQRLRKASEQVHMTVHEMRHTYATQRLQCLDGGKNITTKAVADELGHTTSDQVQKTYGHLARHGHRVRVEGFDYEAPIDTSGATNHPPAT